MRARRRRPDPRLVLLVVGPSGLTPRVCDLRRGPSGVAPRWHSARASDGTRVGLVATCARSVAVRGRPVVAGAFADPLARARGCRIAGHCLGRRSAGGAIRSRADRRRGSAATCAREVADHLVPIRDGALLAVRFHAHLAAGEPVIRVDTDKKETQGACRTRGGPGCHKVARCAVTCTTFPIPRSERTCPTGSTTSSQTRDSSSSSSSSVTRGLGRLLERPVVGWGRLLRLSRSGTPRHDRGLRWFEQIS